MWENTGKGEPLNLNFQVKFPGYDGEQLGFSGYHFFLSACVQKGSVHCPTKSFLSVNHSYDLFLNTLIYRLRQKGSAAFAFSTITSIRSTIHNEFQTYYKSLNMEWNPIENLQKKLFDHLNFNKTQMF